MTKRNKPEGALAGQGQDRHQGHRWGCGGVLTATGLMLADCLSPLLLKLPLAQSTGAKQSFGTRHPSCSNPVLAAPLLVIDDETGSTWVLRWRRFSHSLSTPCPHSLPALPARLHAHILTKNQKREPSSHARRPYTSPVACRLSSMLLWGVVDDISLHTAGSLHFSSWASRGGVLLTLVRWEKYFGQKTESARNVASDRGLRTWSGAGACAQSLTTYNSNAAVFWDSAIQSSRRPSSHSRFSSPQVERGSSSLSEGGEILRSTHWRECKECRLGQ